MKQVLKYPGAKNRIAPWICSLIPPHAMYVEPYAGSLAVFLNKTPSKYEILNDLDGNIVNYFRTIRDNPEELAELISLTPFAREEYHAAYAKTENITATEKARRFAVMCFQGFGNSNTYRNGFRICRNPSGGNRAKLWELLPTTVIEASERIKEAHIENMPAIELIDKHRRKDIFLYIDPPYLPDIRKSNLYRHEMSKKDHIELLDMIKNHPGKIALSGYKNELYDKHLSGWNKEEKETQAEAGIKRIEVIWMNYETNKQLSIWGGVENGPD